MENTTVIVYVKKTDYQIFCLTLKNISKTYVFNKNFKVYSQKMMFDYYIINIPLSKHALFLLHGLIK